MWPWPPPPPGPGKLLQLLPDLEDDPVEPRQLVLALHVLLLLVGEPRLCRAEAPRRGTVEQRGIFARSLSCCLTRRARRDHSLAKPARLPDSI